jgi:hypothetical protein
MTRITPKIAFEGYPDGKRTSFVAGVESEVPDDFARLVIEKGHAFLAGGERQRSTAISDPQTSRVGELSEDLR